ncbi:Oidioi.mRNA.OKI2018_I69.chr2.g4172.t1.cds [Oikopleura dioica]|uniref:Oidioi.mRNA.OKI2018_I69.chr2.g4172.t1.cds n=1 Tax=Oikopleura dioica TaxID=34765 RepID=A0ABN7T0B4_OIKDI|nr:Oidioi.mRNA.OKI2018_I69.chr2.g4172.t1.cds [Oikopleura dioica]
MTDFSELTELILREFHGQKLEDLKNSWKAADKDNKGISCRTFHKLLASHATLPPTIGDQQVKSFSYLLTNGVRQFLHFSDLAGFIKSRTVELGMPRWLKRDHTFIISDEDSWTKDRALSFLSRNWGKFRELLENEFVDEVIEKSSLRKFLLEKFGIYFGDKDFDELWDFLSDGQRISRTNIVWKKLSNHINPGSTCTSIDLETRGQSSPEEVASKIITELALADQMLVRRIFHGFDKLKRGKLDSRRFHLALQKLGIKLKMKEQRLLSQSEVFEKDEKTVLIEKLLARVSALNLISCKR